MEHGHRHVDDVVGAEPETIGKHDPGRGQLVVRAPNRFGITAGSGSEDEHQQIVGLRRRCVGRRIGEGRQQFRPGRRIHVDHPDVAEIDVVE